MCTLPLISGPEGGRGRRVERKERERKAEETEGGKGKRERLRKGLWVISPMKMDLGKTGPDGQS